MTNTDMFFDIAKNINNAQQSSSRYGKLFVLRDLLNEINTLKDIDTATKLKIKLLIEGRIKGIKKDIKNNQVVEDPFLDSM